MLLAATAAGFLGLLLLLVGLRGWRIDDHPLCRRCRFDLVGLPGLRGRAIAPQPQAAGMAAPRCPECGADLSRGRALRIGRRRRMSSALAGAALLLLIGAGLGGAFTWGRVTSFNWNTVKPTWWLMSETANTFAPTQADAVAELTSRLKNGKLTDEQLAILVGRGLAHQAQVQGPWIWQWGDLIESAWNMNLLSREQMASYARNAVNLEVSVRPRIAAGAPGAVRMAVNHPKVGRTRQIWLQPSLVRIQIAGQSLPAPGTMGRIGLKGTASGMIGARLGPIDVEPGEHEMRMTWAVRATENGSETEAPICEWTFDVTAPLTVLPQGAPVVNMVLDEGRRQGVEAAISCPLPIVVRPGAAGASNASASVLFTDLPIGVAFDVFARAEGREWPFGIAVLNGGFRGQHAVGVGGDVPGLTAPKVDLILRPSVAAASNDTEILEIWGEEIVLENVPVRWPKEPGP